MKKPVVFIIFNRPNTTAVVFEEIRKYEPNRLFVIADGPRKNKNGEADLCNEVRNIIKIDWECNVTYIYSDTNLGCQKRISTGLTEVFSLVEEAIILEDDCFPNKDFFIYCEQLLDRYANNDNIMAISGNNFLDNNVKIKDSYYFSKLPHCWGWATWAKSWQKWDENLTNWPDLKRTDEFYSNFPNKVSCEYWSGIFDSCYKKLNNSSWDYIWFYSLLNNKGLAILPRVNLVSNIGFNEDATHTKGDSELSAIPTLSIDFPLIHPNNITVNKEADYYTLLNKYDLETWFNKKKMVELKQAFRNFMKIRGLSIFSRYDEIIIFGMGDWGKELHNILKEISNLEIIKSGNQKNSYITLDLNSNQELEYVKSSAEKRLIINSIEGNHDNEISKKLSEYFINDEVQSWKFYIEKYKGEV